MSQRRKTPARKPRRAGLSILEVLVSIGILVLGLLGVVALIPIAAQHLRRGIALDDATVVARAGVAEFQARGGNNLQKWLRYPPNPGGPPSQPVNGVMNNLWGVQISMPQYSNGNPHDAYVAPTWAFCIDPMMHESVLIQNGTDRDTAFFPYQPNGATLNLAAIQSGQPNNTLGRMLRVTMNWNAVDWRQDNVAAASLNVGLANSMCVSPDDLLLNSPGSGSLALTVADDESPATQYDVSMNSWDDPSIVPIKRNAEGKMSWFATMVPLPGSVADGAHYYTLSVAVCERRDMVIDASRATNVDSTSEALQEVESERTCGVRFIGGGLNGGEVQLVSYQTGPEGLKNLSRLREGNWILISGPNAPAGHIFYWYRIGTIESEPSVSGAEVVRNATLRGPDWPAGVTYVAGDLVGEATIVSNVINVFEQTIELRGE